MHVRWHHKSQSNSSCSKVVAALKLLWWSCLPSHCCCWIVLADLTTKRRSPARKRVEWTLCCYDAFTLPEVVVVRFWSNIAQPLPARKRERAQCSHIDVAVMRRAWEGGLPRAWRLFWTWVTNHKFWLFASQKTIRNKKMRARSCSPLSVMRGIVVQATGKICGCCQWLLSLRRGVRFGNDFRRHARIRTGGAVISFVRLRLRSLQKP